MDADSEEQMSKLIYAHTAVYMPVKCPCVLCTVVNLVDSVLQHGGFLLGGLIGWCLCYAWKPDLVTEFMKSKAKKPRAEHDIAIFMSTEGAFKDRDAEISSQGPAPA